MSPDLRLDSLDNEWLFSLARPYPQFPLYDLSQTFNVGTGLNDKQRQNPPKIGSIIIYRFQELTRDKVPR